MSVNKVILIGNLGADPEVRTTNTGTVIANLRIATTERRKQGEEYVNHTEWHKVVFFGKTAENIQKYLEKGRQVYIEGSLRTTKYQDKEGNERYTTEVVGTEIRFLGGARGEASESPSQASGASTSREPGQNSSKARGGYTGTGEVHPDFGGDIPF